MSALATVKILHNMATDSVGRHIALLRGYVDGDPLEQVLVTRLERDSSNLEEDLRIAELMFEALNVDDDYSPLPALTRRYRMQRNRSLSVGDVVVIDGRACAVASVGYTEISMPGRRRRCHPTVGMTTRTTALCLSADRVRCRHPTTTTPSNY